MNWYIAKLVYRIICRDNGTDSAFDEQLRLLFAEDSLHAFQKARLLGERESYSHTCHQNLLIQWKFIDVTEIHLLDTGLDGAEMYSLSSVQDNADAYIRTIRKKALGLFDQAMEQL